MSIHLECVRHSADAQAIMVRIGSGICALADSHGDQDSIIDS